MNGLHKLELCVKAVGPKFFNNNNNNMGYLISYLVVLYIYMLVPI